MGNIEGDYQPCIFYNADFGPPSNPTFGAVQTNMPRLRFIPTLGKFEDIDQYDSPYEFHSKMNAAANDDTFKTDLNAENKLGDDDLPF